MEAFMLEVGSQQVTVCVIQSDDQRTQVQKLSHGLVGCSIATAVHQVVVDVQRATMQLLYAFCQNVWAQNDRSYEWTGILRETEEALGYMPFDPELLESGTDKISKHLQGLADELARLINSLIVVSDLVDGGILNKSVFSFQCHLEVSGFIA